MVALALPLRTISGERLNPVEVEASWTGAMVKQAITPPPGTRLQALLSGTEVLGDDELVWDFLRKSRDATLTTVLSTALPVKPGTYAGGFTDWDYYVTPQPSIRTTYKLEVREDGTFSMQRTFSEQGARSRLQALSCDGYVESSGVLVVESNDGRDCLTCGEVFSVHATMDDCVLLEAAGCSPTASEMNAVALLPCTQEP
eukprot:CAMPEP_0178465092 /NCGR_PEP_ID=MMETSP0689_2-20121128/51179_1 /TAXON_ID=160604 /ORGANISM="Amphidinium massartii, Strain CS-259" /LENGTH=199 /DNA_ID=CAMNT_0020092013 /DNA_START=1 /DNA_END=600 /DNA_ORIENTATION=+